MTEYAEKLKDPRWQKKRLKIFERDQFKCNLCGDEETTLNVHHKEYLSDTEIWDYPNELLITLCQDCHELISFIVTQGVIIDINIVKAIKKKDKIKCLFLFYGDECALRTEGKDCIITARLQKEFLRELFHIYNNLNGKKIY